MPGPGMLDRSMCLLTQPQTSTLPCDDVYDSGFVGAPTLALNYITVDPRLKVVLQVGKSIEVEVE